MALADADRRAPINHSRTTWPISIFYYYYAVDDHWLTGDILFN
jgi:hypothetical protein